MVSSVWPADIVNQHLEGVFLCILQSSAPRQIDEGRGLEGERVREKAKTEMDCGLWFSK